MSGTAAAKEPTMEDILASIRKIISEEDKTTGTSDAAADDTGAGQPWKSSISEQSTPARQSYTETDTSQANLASTTPASAVRPSASTAPSAGGQSGNAPKTLAELAAASALASSGDSVAQPDTDANAVIDAADSLQSAMGSPNHENRDDAARSALAALAAGDNAGSTHSDQATEEAASTTAGLPTPVPAATRDTGTDEAEAFRGALMSPETGLTVGSVFERLKSSEELDDDLNNSVDGLLQPMLRDWLDENLPSLVERLVREEIERVSRGRRA